MEAESKLSVCRSLRDRAAGTRLSSVQPHRLHPVSRGQFASGCLHGPLLTRNTVVQCWILNTLILLVTGEMEKYIKVILYFASATYISHILIPLFVLTGTGKRKKALKSRLAMKMSLALFQLLAFNQNDFVIGVYD